jgi:hypothetical protein
MLGPGAVASLMAGLAGSRILVMGFDRGSHRRVLPFRVHEYRGPAYMSRERRARFRKRASRRMTGRLSSLFEGAGLHPGLLEHLGRIHDRYSLVNDLE